MYTSPSYTCTHTHTPCTVRACHYWTIGELSCEQSSGPWSSGLAPDVCWWVQSFHDCVEPVNPFIDEQCSSSAAFRSTEYRWGMGVFDSYWDLLSGVNWRGLIFLLLFLAALQWCPEVFQRRQLVDSDFLLMHIRTPYFPKIPKIKITWYLAFAHTNTHTHTLGMLVVHPETRRLRIITYGVGKTFFKWPYSKC